MDGGPTPGRVFGVASIPVLEDDAMLALDMVLCLPPTSLAWGLPSTPSCANIVCTEVDDLRLPRFLASVTSRSSERWP